MLEQYDDGLTTDEVYEILKIGKSALYELLRRALHRLGAKALQFVAAYFSVLYIGGFSVLQFQDSKHNQ